VCAFRDGPRITRRALPPARPIIKTLAVIIKGNEACSSQLSLEADGPATRGHQMSPRREQNRITFPRHEKASGFEASMAEINERNRRKDRFDVWFFMCVWAVITTVAGLAIYYD